MTATYAVGDTVSFRHGRGWLPGEIIAIDRERAQVRTRWGFTVWRKLAGAALSPLAAATSKTIEQKE